MKYAQNRNDLSIICDVRSKLSNISSELELIDPEYARCVDEDCKVAQHHSFKMVELRKLSQLAEALQMQVELVFCGHNQPRAEQLTDKEHIARIVEARKCCQALANSTREGTPIEIERLIDPLDQVADRYAAEHLPHLSKEELAKAEEELLAEQARAILQKIA